MNSMKNQNVEHIVAVISKTRNKAKVCMQCEYYEKIKLLSIL